MIYVCGGGGGDDGGGGSGGGGGGRRPRYPGCPTSRRSTSGWPSVIYVYSGQVVVVVVVVVVTEGLTTPGVLPQGYRRPHGRQ